MVNLSTEQRERLLYDIMNYESELAFSSSDTFSEKDQDILEIDLEAADDEHLQHWWRTTVGEWLCSIGGEYPSFINEWETEGEFNYDNPADWQLEKLLEGEPRDYSWYAPRYTSY